MKFSDPHDIHIKDYNYHLPEERIAKYPLTKRDSSKLLVYRNSMITDDQFSSIAEHLPKDGLMIFNNTRVIQARLPFNKTTGAAIEIFCLEPHFPHDYNLIFQATQKCTWICMIGNLKKWKDGILEKDIVIDDKTLHLIATKIKSFGNSHLIEFSWDNPQLTFAEILDTVGELPIPPYLNRRTEENDKQTYQTVYSKIKGSVAAPTAGLHFTEEVFEQIHHKRIRTEEVTLHVGAGTFKPVKSETIDEHEMHSEFISVKRELIEKLINHEGGIIAVGTTSVRTLESLYHIGCSLSQDMTQHDLKVSQWQAYETNSNLLTKEEALKNIITYLDLNNLNVLLADTQIMIIPSYQFKIVDAIVTNFHQPQSTLLLLVSAFVKGEWKSIYNHALDHNYRFLSYGDSSLLFPE